MKNLFSERYRYKRIKLLQPNEMPDYLRKRIWNFLQKCINEGEFVIQKNYETRVDRDKVIKIIWDNFFKEDLNELKIYWREEYT